MHFKPSRLYQQTVDRYFFFEYTKEGGFVYRKNLYIYKSITYDFLIYKTIEYKLKISKIN